MIRRNTARSIGTFGLVAALMLPPATTYGLTKTAEKGLFAGGLLAFGGLVRWAIRRDDAKTARVRRELRRTWGEPTRVTTTALGFDRFRVEYYRREDRRLIVVFRNERLIRLVESLVDAGRDPAAGADDGNGGRAHAGSAPL